MLLHTQDVGGIWSIRIKKKNKDVIKRQIKKKKMYEFS